MATANPVDPPRACRCCRRLVTSGDRRSDQSRRLGERRRREASCRLELDRVPRRVGSNGFVETERAVLIECLRSRQRSPGIERRE